MGLFKGMKDLASLTKQAKELQENQQQQAGYKPGMGGAFQQMGDMLGDANEQLSELNQMGGAQSGVLATGTPGEGIVVGHGVPARGAQWFNMDIDMEIHVSGRAPYRVNNMYMVPASATIGAGVTLPVKVDQSDPSKIAIDWNAAQTAPSRGEVRPSGGGVTASAAPTQGEAPAGPGGDSVAELERLAKLRDSGALTEAEFQSQKARILGS